MNSNLPVIFLTFANEQQGGRYLDNVVKESKALTAILSPVSENMNHPNRENALCELVVRNNVNIGEIIEVFNAYKDREIIFHFGGHADGYQLLLEGKDGEAQVAKGEGLVPILSRRKNLKMVFLNGCSTQRLAHDLVERGIPSVIGTSASISDEVALMLSTRFYKGLATGLTMAGAWEEAKDEVRAVKDIGNSVRGIKLTKAGADRFPWDVEYRDDAAKEVFENWNLPEAAQNPLLFLPKLKEAQLPVEPFLFLKPYESRHAEIFFGRSRYIRDLWQKIVEPATPPLILLYGESGAGKSSLLDAGLRPRLEMAAKDESPDEPIFDVRYERRDQDEGLVVTLARLLGYQPEAESRTGQPEPEAAAAGQKAAQARELEKLQRIEILARELEEEKAKYTFLSIIDRYRELQSDGPKKIVSAGLYQGGRLDPRAGGKLRSAWKKIEEESGRRLIIILDQVEELFTRPNPNQEKELEDLLQIVKEIFSYNDDSAGESRIRGKIILGYREEYNAKIEARVKDRELSRTTVFLEQLNETDINDIFRGLQSGRAKKEYNIQVEDKLPGLIANNLLNGKTAVAPVLQLLLTKLWKRAYSENSHEPAFTVETYQEVQSKGEEMEAYFNTQIKKVRTWNSDSVESGLVLDILHFHVSDLGTSNRRHIETIRLRYRHLDEEFDYPDDFIFKLVDKLKSPEIFLLNDLGWGYTGLPHDTLAPIIIREYNRSDKLGQRSARILDTKTPDLVRAISKGEDELKKLCLDENDLEVVQGGKKGMRALEDRERKLLQISLEEREKRLRLRRILYKGGIAAGLFILILSILAGSLSVSMTEHVKNGVISRANEASLTEQENNPVKSIQLAQFAYNESETHPLEVVGNLYDLYGKYAGLDPYAYFYEEPESEPENFDLISDVSPEGPEDGFDDSIAVSGPVNPSSASLLLSRTLKAETGIRSLAYHPKLGYLCSLSDTTVKYWPIDKSKGSKTIDLSQGFQDIRDLEFGFSADGKMIQVLYRTGRDPLYLLEDELIHAPFVTIYLQDESYTYSVAAETPATPFGYYDFFLGKFVDEMGLYYTRDEFDECLEDYHYGFNSAIYVELTSGGIEEVNADSLFSFRLLDEKRNLLRLKDLRILKNKGWKIIDEPVYDNQSDHPVISLRSTHLTWGTDNMCLLGSPETLEEGPEFVYQNAEELLYLTALSANRFLTVDQNGKVSVNDVNGMLIRDLLPQQSGIQDIAISPDNRHILAMTAEDLVYIWDLEGHTVAQFTHPDIEYFAFSPDGKRVLTQSSRLVRVWFENSGREPVTYTNPKDAPPVNFTHFHPNNSHLVIGLSNPGEVSKWGKIFGFLSRGTPSQIVLWNPEDQEKEFFKGPKGPLLDAAVSADGRFAVALQAGGATIIPNGNERIRAREYRSNPIEATDTGKAGNPKNSSVFLSPGGKYIVRQFPFDSRVELFNLQGTRLNAYGFQNRFRQGFNGQLFTPDDYYLIGSRAKEVMFWHPEDDAVTTWANDFELYLDEKQQYNLDTFMDYIPGSSLDAKWWAISVILVSLLFVLLYFSDFIIKFIQQKKYIELILYAAGFSLLSLLFIMLWGIGTLEPEIKRGAFYGISLATLVLTSVGIRRAWKLKKINVLIALGLVSCFVLFGTMKFYSYETIHHEEQFEKQYKREIQLDYAQRQSLYDNLYQAGLGLASSTSRAGKDLKPEQLKSLVEEHQIDVPQPARESEWLNIFSSLFILLLFSGLVGYPLYRAISKYQAEKLAAPAFFYWLFLPAGILSAAFWIAFGIFTQDEFGYAIADLLAIISSLMLLAFIIRQSRKYIKGKYYTRLAVFAIPVLLTGLILLTESGQFALALAATSLSGWLFHRQKALGKFFLLTCCSIFLAIGGIGWALASGNGAILLGFPLAGLLAFELFALRHQLGKMEERKAAGKTRWGNRLAILGLWILGLTGSIYFADELLYNSTEEDWAEEYDAGYRTKESLTEPVEGAGEEDEAFNTQEQAFEDPSNSGPDDGLTGSGELIDEQDREMVPPPEEPAPSDPGPSTDTPLDQLAGYLFHPVAIFRTEALSLLENYHLNDNALTGELIRAGNLYPGQKAGTDNVLYLLEKIPKEVLQSHREPILLYLEKVSAPGTEDRIQALRYLIIY